MKKKTLIIVSMIFILYIFIIYYYLFYLEKNTIPMEFKNTRIDPATFMTAEQLKDSMTYSQIKNFLFFLTVPLEWFFYFLILTIGVSKALIYWTYNFKTKLRGLFFTVGLVFLSGVFFLPLQFYSYRLSVMYNISTQSMNTWLKDYTINWFIELVYMIVVVYIFSWLYKKYLKKWWIYAWICMVPITLIMVFFQPVVIDPLFNKFTPLEDKALETKILELAKKANIPSSRVFQVNMSEKTSSLNAYVTGIGSNSRIVLWDTTLETLTDEEILFVMAHEMSHYVNKDVYRGIGMNLAVNFVGLWLLSVIIKKYIDKRDLENKLTLHPELQVIPLLLIASSIMSFAYQPFSNIVSRMQERNADEYAVQLTQNPEAGFSSFQKLSAYGLVDIYPPKLVKIFRYSHPTMLERLEYLSEKITELE